MDVAEVGNSKEDPERNTSPYEGDTLDKFESRGCNKV
jgi:hypothetical protein